MSKSLTVYRDRPSDEENNRILARVEYVLESQGRTAGAAAHAPPSNHYNFHAPVGAVQTGSGSTANVTQRFDSVEVEKLVDALKRFAQQLNAMPVSDPATKNEVIAVTRDLESELKAPTPNRFKLKAIFDGLTTFVQTLGSAPEAYQTIDNILRTLGLI